jgi:hypothetical protein
VPVIGDRAERRFDELPASLILESEPHRTSDEPAATAWAYSPVEVTNEIIGQRNV